MGTTVTAGWPVEEQKDRAWDCTPAWQLRGGPECHGSLGGSYFRARLLLAQDVVAGKPNYSGMLCSNALLLCPTHLRLGTPPYLF